MRRPLRRWLNRLSAQGFCGNALFQARHGTSLPRKIDLSDRPRRSDQRHGKARGAGHAERGLQAVLSLRNRHGSLIRRNRNIKNAFMKFLSKAGPAAEAIATEHDDLAPDRFGANTCAVYGDCGKFRYRLWRRWDNDEAMRAVARSCSMGVCARSHHARHRDRESQVLSILDITPSPPLCFSSETLPLTWLRPPKTPKAQHG